MSTHFLEPLQSTTNAQQYSTPNSGIALSRISLENCRRQPLPTNRINHSPILSSIFYCKSYRIPESPVAFRISLGRVHNICLKGFTHDITYPHVLRIHRRGPRSLAPLLSLPSSLQYPGNSYHKDRHARQRAPRRLFPHSASTGNSYDMPAAFL